MYISCCYGTDKHPFNLYCIRLTRTQHGYFYAVRCKWNSQTVHIVTLLAKRDHVFVFHQSLPPVLLKTPDLFTLYHQSAYVWNCRQITSETKYDASISVQFLFSYFISRNKREHFFKILGRCLTACALMCSICFRFYCHKISAEGIKFEDVVHQKFVRVF